MKHPPKEICDCDCHNKKQPKDFLCCIFCDDEHKKAIKTPTELKKFPRYTREENRACKLLDEQIEEIKLRKKDGESYASIAKDFSVTPQAIFYWCLDDDERKARGKERRQRIKDSGYERPTLCDLKAYRKRKKQLHPELKEYEFFSALRYQKENPEIYSKIRQKADKKYLIKNKEKIYAGNLLWRKQHREFLRQMGEFYRGKRKIKPKISNHYE